MQIVTLAKKEAKIRQKKTTVKKSDFLTDLTALNKSSLLFRKSKNSVAPGQVDEDTSMPKLSKIYILAYMSGGILLFS